MSIYDDEATREKLRERIATKLYPTYGQEDRNRSLAIAGAVMTELRTEFDQICKERDEWRRVAAEQTRMERERAEQAEATIDRVREYVETTDDDGIQTREMVLSLLGEVT